LPITVPLASPEDWLAAFAVKPDIHLEDLDQWEVFDPLLNGLVGWGISTEEISQIIHPGPLGMDGFCDWIEVLLTEGNISEVLLKGKILCLIEVMENCKSLSFLVSWHILISLFMKVSFHFGY
jgi:hypothetical protein